MGRTAASQALQVTRTEFYEMLAERLPRCLKIIDQHLDENAPPSAQRWGVELIFNRLLPTLLAAPAGSANLADALKNIMKDRGLDGAEDPEPGVQDVEIVPEGEARHITVLKPEQP